MLSNQEGKFYTVGLFFIVVGAAIFAMGLVGWYLAETGLALAVTSPVNKVIGGAIIILLGYIQLELELIRNKKN